jgi:hypothetical protein
MLVPPDSVIEVATIASEMLHVLVPTHSFYELSTIVHKISMMLLYPYIFTRPFSSTWSCRPNSVAKSDQSQHLPVSTSASFSEVASTLSPTYAPRHGPNFVRPTSARTSSVHVPDNIATWLTDFVSTAARSLLGQRPCGICAVLYGKSDPRPCAPWSPRRW